MKIVSFRSGLNHILFSALHGSQDLAGAIYISFKNSKGEWTTSKNMGNIINSEHHELCSFVTSDGKYLFYTSDEDIYWVSTSIIDQLR